MMRPEEQLIAIKDNEEQIVKLLSELVLLPRINALKWSKITRQTPNIKIGYPGQHLASLISGILGEGTGARGNDLRDGTEVKSCSRIDQLDQCGDCKLPVTRFEQQCPECISTNILRKNDSKWLFSVRSEGELKTLTQDVKRIMLLLGDYPNFDSSDFETIRFQAFEIWTNSARNKRFREIITNYYYKIYLEHKRRNVKSNPAPKNFWPYSYQFYLCNPINVFSCTVTNANIEPSIVIDNFVTPETDRATVSSVLMPLNIISDTELLGAIQESREEELHNILYKKSENLSKQQLLDMSIKDLRALIIGFDENMREYLPLRDTDKISTAKEVYTRRNSLI